MTPVLPTGQRPAMCAHISVCMHVKDPLPFFIRVRALHPGGGFLLFTTFTAFLSLCSLSLYHLTSSHFHFILSHLFPAPHTRLHFCRFLSLVPTTTFSTWIPLTYPTYPTFLPFYTLLSFQHTTSPIPSLSLHSSHTLTYTFNYYHYQEKGHFMFLSNQERISIKHSHYTCTWALLMGN